MKRFLSLSLLGSLPLIPAVSCTPLTISNENPQISNWNEALNTIANNQTLVKEIEKDYVISAFNSINDPTSYEVLYGNDQVNLFEEIAKGTIIVDNQDFTYPTYIIGNEFNITLKAFTITNIAFTIKANFGDGMGIKTKVIDPENKIKITLKEPIQFKTNNKFWEQGVK